MAIVDFLFIYSYFSNLDVDLVLLPVAMAMGSRGFCSRLIPGPSHGITHQYGHHGNTYHHARSAQSRQLRALESFLFARYKQRESGELYRDLQ